MHVRTTAPGAEFRGIIIVKDDSLAGPQDSSTIRAAA
jgi:hypothetical protein